MRSIVELLMRTWPFNRIMVVFWRYFPFPRGMRSRIMRTANDMFLVGVMVLIHDEQGRLLLVRNTYEPSYTWSLPGGWMGKHEQPVDCIKRELREETGYEIEIDGLVAARTHGRLPSVDLIYRGQVVGGTFRPSAEVTAAEFFPADALPEGFSSIHRSLLASIPEWRAVCSS